MVGKFSETDEAQSECLIPTYLPPPLCPQIKVDESGKNKNFKPAKDGCWIVQNSWGTYVGYSGLWFMNRY